MLVSAAVSPSVPPAVLLAVGAAVGAVLALAVVALVARRRRAADGGPGADREVATLVDRAQDLVLVHAPDGSGLEPNVAARTVLGLAEGAGRLSLLDAVVLDDQPAVRAHLATLASTGTARTDLRLRGPGAGRPFDVVSRVVGGRALTVARDVADRADRERRATAERDRALAAVRDKSAFLDAMSPDLRTPLTAVLGFAELLRDDVDPESRGLVEAIETGGRRLLRTLDGVLDLARLDAGRAALHPAPLDVAAAVERAVAPHRPAAAAAGLALAVEAPGAVPATLDPDVVARVVDTLVSNAVAFTESGGVTVEVVDDAATVTIRVLDTGPGIADDVLPDLFSEHRRQPGADGTAPVGVTALGLAVARRLVELAGGTISVESRWGRGTAFTVVLPRGPVPEVESAAAVAA